MPPEARRVLITGAGSGIGRALALGAASRGMAVGLCGRREQRLRETAELLGPSVPTLVIAADVTRAEDRSRIAARVADAWGGLHVLINNAGAIEAGPVDAISDEVVEAIFRTNVTGPMALVRELLPSLCAARPSRVVNVGSIFGDIPYPGFAAYSASKFALRGYSMALRRECKPKGIGVTYAAPRATRTEAAAAFAALIAASNMKLDTPDAVADQIWNAIDREDDAVYAAGPEKLYVLIQRVFPRLVDRALARQAKRTAQTEPERAHAFD